MASKEGLVPVVRNVSFELLMKPGKIFLLPSHIRIGLKKNLVRHSIKMNRHLGFFFINSLDPVKQ